MTSTEREPRYGLHTYEVKVSTVVAPSGVLYLNADSITVSPAGALMMGVEMFPVEAFGDDGEPDPRAGVELPPTTVLAPGQWYSVRMVDDELRPIFTSGEEMKP